MYKIVKKHKVKIAALSEDAIVRREYDLSFVKHMCLLHGGDIWTKEIKKDNRDIEVPWSCGLLTAPQLERGLICDSNLVFDSRVCEAFYRAASQGKGETTPGTACVICGV